MDLLSVVIVVVLLVATGGLSFWLGSRRRPNDDGTMATTGKRLEEYSFYPFVTNEDGHVEFEAELFTEGVRHLLDNDNPRAGRELIVIGEQNLVRDTFPSEVLADYKRLYADLSPLFRSLAHGETNCAGTLHSLALSPQELESRDVEVLSRRRKRSIHLQLVD